MSQRGTQGLIRPMMHTRMDSRSIQAPHITTRPITLRIMWRRQRPSILGSSQIVIAIVGSMVVLGSVAIAMGSGVVVMGSGAMEPRVAVMGSGVENVADIRTAELEAAAGEEIALRRPHGSHQTLAAVLF